MLSTPRSPIDPVTGRSAESLRPEFPHPSPSQEDVDPQQIKQDIDRTRAHMDETLDELGERLRPRRLMEEILDMIPFASHQTVRDAASGLMKDAAKHAGVSAWSQIRKHPMPAALIGAGVTWMLIESNRKSRPATSGDDMGQAPGPWQRAKTHVGNTASHMGQRIASVAEQAGEAAGAAAQTVQQGARAATDSIRDATSSTGHALSDGTRKVKDVVTAAGHRLAESAQHARSALAETTATTTHALREGADTVSHKLEEGYQYGRSAAQEAWDRSPAAFGLAALGAGVALGMLLPRSRQEDHWIGEQADRLRRQARKASGHARDRGKRAGVKAADVAAAEAERQGLTPQSLVDAAIYVVKESGRRAGEVMKQVAEEKGLTPEALQRKAQAVVHEVTQTVKNEGLELRDELKEDFKTVVKPT